MNKEIDCKCETCLREQKDKKKLEDLIKFKGIDFSPVIVFVGLGFVKRIVGGVF